MTSAYIFAVRSLAVDHGQDTYTCCLRYSTVSDILELLFTASGNVLRPPIEVEFMPPGYDVFEVRSLAANYGLDALAVSNTVSDIFKLSCTASDNV